MKWNNIEELLHRYYEGETTVAEEEQLKRFFVQERELPKHLQPHAAQFQHYVQQQEAQLDKFLADDWLFEKVEQQAPQQGKLLFFPIQQVASYWRIAASILLLAGAFWAGSQYMKQSSTAEQAPQIAALQQEVQEMKRVLAAGATGAYTTSDRLRVVSQEFSAAPEEDEEIINLLIGTMNNDPNVNVRLAATEALSRYKDNEKVRAAFIKALPMQTDPLMQITLIDMLVKIKEKKALEPLQKLAEKEDLLPIVKNKAEEGIGILI